MSKCYPTQLDRLPGEKLTLQFLLRKRVISHFHIPCSEDKDNLSGTYTLRYFNSA